MDVVCVRQVHCVWQVDDVCLLCRMQTHHKDRLGVDREAAERQLVAWPRCLSCDEHRNRPYQLLLRPHPQGGLNRVILSS